MAVSFRPFLLYLLIATAVCVADLATKECIQRLLPEGGGMAVTSFFNFVFHYNKGVTFGLLTHDHPAMPWILSIMAIVIVGFLLAWLWRAQNEKLTPLALALVIGGALGNIHDRIRFGGVRDFLDFHVAGWHWPAFNVADSGVVVGVALIILAGLVKPVARQ